MSGQAIAQYFAKVKLLVEPASIKNVDDFLKKIEKSLGKVSTATTKEVKAKKDSTVATEKKVKAVEKEAKATFDLAKAQEKQKSILKKADDEALKRANAFLAVQKKLANAAPKLKSLTEKQISSNRAAFFKAANASDIRTDQGLQYRLGAQLDGKIRQLQAAQKAFLASRAKQTGGSDKDVFEQLQLRLASKLKVPRQQLSENQINKNRAAFFKAANTSDIRTGQGLQYRLGAQLDSKIRQLQAAQKAFLASRAKQSSSGSFDKDVFDQLRLRLASKLRAPRQSLSENQINKNRAAFFKTANALETKTGQGLQYRLGDQAAKIQQATLRQQEQAAANNQRAARRVSDSVEKGLRDLEREIQKAFSTVQNSRARLNAARGRPLNTGGSDVPPNRGSVPIGGGGGPQPGRSGASFSRANFLHAGGAGGALARYGLASLPFVGGVYGLGALNTANQELISGQLTTQAVLAAKGYSTQQGVDANKWLFGLANNVGFNYMEALPDYNQFLSNSLGAGLGVEQSQDIFKGFSEYQTAMGVTPARRKLVQNALSQMLGKGVLSMEEVDFSLAA